MAEPPVSTHRLFEAHPRSFKSNRYVYPVLSRRAGGISVGVNLNRDKACNFNCVYCQVDRATPGSPNPIKPEPIKPEPIELERLADELQHTVELVTSGEIFNGPKFSRAPRSLRRLNDIALSGDGEPTICSKFAEAVTACAGVRRRCCPQDVKLVLITNGSMFHRAEVRGGLETLDAANGEIWAKLDAGTETYYRQIARSNVPFRQILDNLAEAAVARPIVIQSLFARLHGQPPPPAELDAYCRRLDQIISAGGRIKLVQIHTVARAPAEHWVSALADAEVDAIANQLHRRTGLPVAGFHG